MNKSKLKYIHASIPPSGININKQYTLEELLLILSIEKIKLLFEPIDKDWDEILNPVTVIEQATKEVIEAKEDIKETTQEETIEKSVEKTEKINNKKKNNTNKEID
jgi:hypothetical protein